MVPSSHCDTAPHRSLGSPLTQLAFLTSAPLLHPLAWALPIFKRGWLPLRQTQLSSSGAKPQPVQVRCVLSRHSWGLPASGSCSNDLLIDNLESPGLYGPSGGSLLPPPGDLWHYVSSFKELGCLNSLNSVEYKILWSWHAW